MKHKDNDIALLCLKERLTENLSSFQIAATLDDLILKALTPILETGILEKCLVEVLPFTMSNKRRKFSAMDREDFIDKLFTLIVTTNNSNKIAIIKELRLERTIYFTTFKLFFNATEQLDANFQAYTSSPLYSREESIAYENLLNMASSLNMSINQMISRRQEALYWYNLAIQFKQMVTEKFVRLAYVEASKAITSTNLNISKSDLFRDLIMSISKAIDKYDSAEGPLTNYIKWWFMDAKNNAQGSHEYGIAYKIPIAQRRKLLESGAINMTVELNEQISSETPDESDTILDNIINAQECTNLGSLAVSLPEARVASLMEGVFYTPTAADKLAMQATLSSMKL